VAELMKDRPFLYRIHEKPSPEKMEKLAKTLKAYQVPVPHGFEQGRSEALQKVLKSVEGKPISPVIHMMCLRSLMKAVYSPQNAGHYGLASPFYTHFTSPIRRYPDLCVHRIVKEALAQRSSPERRSHWKLALPEVCQRSSTRERMAQELERESLQLHRVQLMKKRVGETFDAIITGVSPFGFFVQPEEVFVEGLVPVAGIRDDYYSYDEVRATLRGRRTGKAFAMGQKVRVRLAAANDVKRQLDFELSTEAPPKKEKKPWYRRFGL
jgi:ribonuclease R